MSLPLSVVVVAYGMQRELPRTLRTLASTYQRGIDGDDYEVIVVDNGSPEPLDPSSSAHIANLRNVRIDPAPASPARAANTGVRMADGELVGLIVDGARMSSPGLLAAARAGSRAAPRAVVTAPGWHLGPVRHNDAAAAGYDQAAEDRLLEQIDWERDGDRLFEVSTPAHSSARGLFGPMGESSALFMAAELWEELGGLDERFVLPGGGLVNHDLYRRACELDGVQLVVLLGDGTFHQVHGGAATSERVQWDEMHAEYERIRGQAYRPPTNEPLYVGRVPRSLLPHVESSARLAIERGDRWR